MICVNCKTETKRISKGRCPACDTYLRRNKKERVIINGKVQKPTKSPCINCLLPPGIINQRCKNCYEYLRIHHTERPIKPPKPTKCLICKKRKPLKDGKCNRCYSYEQRTGIERPTQIPSRAKPCSNCKKLGCRTCQNKRYYYSPKGIAKRREWENRLKPNSTYYATPTPYKPNVKQCPNHTTNEKNCPECRKLLLAWLAGEDNE